MPCIIEQEFDSGEVWMTSVTIGTRRNQQATPRAIASRQREQRREYARVVLRALARSLRGRPASQVHRVLRDSLKPLGVRLPAATLQELAADIAAGRPVQLP
jgi:hypothetical protein